MQPVVLVAVVPAVLVAVAVGLADPSVEEAVLARPLAVVHLEEVVGAEAVVLVAVAEPLAVELLAVVLLAEPVVLLAVVMLAVVLVANNRYRSKGHGYRRCYRCRDRGRYHHPDRCHRYRGASPSHPSHLCRLSFLSNSFQAPGKMVGQMPPRKLAQGGTDTTTTFFHHYSRGIEISYRPPFGRGPTAIWAASPPSLGTCLPSRGLIAWVRRNLRCTPNGYF